MYNCIYINESTRTREDAHITVFYIFKIIAFTNIDKCCVTYHNNLIISKLCLPNSQHAKVVCGGKITAKMNL